MKNLARSNILQFEIIGSILDLTSSQAQHCSLQFFRSNVFLDLQEFWVLFLRSPFHTSKVFIYTGYKCLKGKEN